VEGRQATAGAADVVVCDGFAGNVVLKVAEGMVTLIFDLIRGAVRSRLHYKLAGLILRPALRRAAQPLDYREHGSAPLLGVRGLVFIAHGRSDATAIASGLRSAHAAAQRGLLDHLTTQLATRPPRTASTAAESTP
ncbi:MAG: phosphate--acyl-ACP acyltransferase, partial [Chloroflexota bacterium]|nr:phosphate--acyl-ACP acyltransferase [Chloroflexota bacterium]